jgi:hypothetical protein
MKEERQTADSSGSGSNTVDYSEVDLPDKPRTEWHYTQRRAELLQLVREAGHPGDINQTKIAERFDVSQQQISKDLDRIGDHIRSNTSIQRRTLRVDSTINRAIRGLLDDGDYYKAGQLALDYDEWLRESGIGDADASNGADPIMIMESVVETDYSESGTDPA